MSSLNQLTIQGIRSFGMKAEDKQAITFSAPLTLILGANGCGKTTIIECLKYALTGELPPGSDRGAGFVHDPKIFDAVEGLGQVKLQVRNIRGKTLTVTRSVQVTKKGKAGQSFKALPPTVTYGDSENDNETFSKRVVDVDSEVIQFMGVSKAIINNVIFCHQENASWPLDEPKKLKEKFDAIFGTTKYDKAIEKIIKMKKEQQSLLTQKNGDLKFAERIKYEAETKNLELETNKQKKNAIKELCNQLNEDLKPIETRLIAIQKIEFDINKILTQRTELQTNIKNCAETIKSLKAKIKTLFDGNTPELERKIRSFKEQVNEKKNELVNLKDQLNLLNNKEKKIQSSLNELNRQGTTLAHKRQQEQEYLAQRAEKISKLCGNLSITAMDDIETAQESQIKALFDKITNQLALEQQKITQLSAEHDKIEQNKQIEIDNCRENKIKFESDHKTKKIQLEKKIKERGQLKNEINKSESDSKKLNSITQDVERVEKFIKELEEKVNFEQKKAEIDAKKSDIKRKKEEYSKLDERLTYLNTMSKKLAEIELKDKDLEKREQVIKKIKNKHSENIKTIFPNEIIESNYKRKFDAAKEDLQKKIKELKNKENSDQLKLKELQIKRKNKKDELNKYEKEYEQTEERIFDKLQGESYEDFLALSKENVEKFTLELGALKSTESVFKKYIKNIENDPCCPLCHKNLTQNEATDMKSEMFDEIHRVPAKIKETEISLKKEQRNYEDLMSLGSIIEKNKKLKEDIPLLKTDLMNIEEKLTSITNEVKSSILLIAEPTSKLEIVTSILGDMTLLDDSIKEMSRIEEDLRNLKASIPSDVEISNLEDLQLEKSTLVEELKVMEKNLELFENEYHKDMNSYNKLRESRSNLKDTQIKLQEGIQQLPQLKKNYEIVIENINTIEKEIETLEIEIQPLISKLDNLNKEKGSLKIKHRNILNEKNKELESLRKIYHDIERYNKDLKVLAEENLEVKLEKLKNSLKQVESDQTNNNKEKSEVNVKIENLNSDISNQELIERDLNDNLELKRFERKESELKNTYEDLNKEISDLNHEQLSKERKELLLKRETITNKRGEKLGQATEIENQIKKLEKELNDPQFKESLKNYRKQFYEVQILKKVINDLSEYQFALDKALTQFHSEKMKKINRLIREFWRQIYRGNDIDFIEIKTENEDSKAATASDKRRTFNYSVVQSKNNSKIEMRGRCSAGQRVLASLIIRMALAETFSSNCGVLALDEPTTNLDRNNIFSLCETLKQIIEERRTQCNFMLIIITHDEEFIRAMDKIKSYHKVSRNSEGKSQIRKCLVSAL